MITSERVLKIVDFGLRRDGERFDDDQGGLWGHRLHVA